MSRLRIRTALVALIVVALALGQVAQAKRGAEHERVLTNRLTVSEARRKQALVMYAAERRSRMQWEDRANSLETVRVRGSAKPGQ